MTIDINAIIKALKPHFPDDDITPILAAADVYRAVTVVSNGNGNGESNSGIER
ncbi:hypothetical protein GJ688_08800 [Heliobacillus mobilis]|uniref:Uncharacterized protein n=1 Tax=Heliobacterium mobile TaxID=28064 RepID=A0A6I3SJU2_HELMO|nr:hypothetical protein [Heliobacterium mobile]MTV49076.1 hypothetical protein [Heliobacterium mobile]